MQDPYTALLRIPSTIAEIVAFLAENIDRAGCQVMGMEEMFTILHKTSLKSGFCSCSLRISISSIFSPSFCNFVSFQVANSPTMHCNSCSSPCKHRPTTATCRSVRARFSARQSFAPPMPIMFVRLHYFSTVRDGNLYLDLQEGRDSGCIICDASPPWLRCAAERGMWSAVGHVRQRGVRCDHRYAWSII